MQFLTNKQSKDWCLNHQVSAEDNSPSPPQGMPNRCFKIPSDAGRRIALSKMLWDSFGAGQPEVLIWIDTWGVWGSGEHLPLYTALRTVEGNNQTLNDSPGHLLRLGDDEKAVSIVCVCTLFLWDGWIVPADGQSYLFLSHDEFGCVYAQDMHRLKELENRLVGFDLELIESAY